MNNSVSFALILCGFVVVFLLCLYMRRQKKENGCQFDERQLAARGKAYKLAFFTLVVYNGLYACLEEGGTKWCTPSVGLAAGLFLGVTVFGVTAIRLDAFSGIRKNVRGTVVLWAFLILCQLSAFLSEVKTEGFTEEGLLALPFISLFCAICLFIMMAVFLVHEMRLRHAEAEA